MQARKFVEITVTFTKEEAEWLHAVMQDKLIGEDLTGPEFRENLWNCLNLELHENG
jgi:hypothetical protein